MKTSERLLQNQFREGDLHPLPASSGSEGMTPSCADKPGLRCVGPKACAHVGAILSALSAFVFLSFGDGRKGFQRAFCGADSEPRADYRAAHMCQLSRPAAALFGVGETAETLRCRSDEKWAWHLRTAPHPPDSPDSAPLNNGRTGACKSRGARKRNQSQAAFCCMEDGQC